MTTFHSRQSDCGRGVRKNANASTFQIHVTKCTTKLRAQVHEARKIQCNNFSTWCNHKVQCYRFNEVQALPLDSTRFLRLAKSSPLAARSPARRPRDDRAMSGKIAGEMSCGIAAQLPGNGRTVAAAMPPNVRQDGLQDNLPCAGFGRAMSAPETCETTRNLAVRQPRNGQCNVSQAARGNPVVSFQP